VAYGDENGPSRPVPWEEFEYREYLYRMGDLNKEWRRAFAIAHGNPNEDPARVEAADKEWRRRSRHGEAATGSGRAARTSHRLALRASRTWC
jgi:hypothetical protein